MRRSKKPRSTKSIKTPIHTDIPKPNPPLSIEEALIRNTINQNHKVSYQSILFDASFVLTSKSLSQQHYINGMRIGRSAYGIISNAHNEFVEQHLADLVSFLQHAGYLYTTQSTDINGMRINIYPTEKVYLGSNVHIFESGIISGFMSAALKRSVQFGESSCINNGAACCTFVQNKPPYLQSATKLPLLKFIEHASMVACSYNKIKFSTISDHFASLSSLTLCEKEYLKEVKKIVYHIGTICANIIFPQEHKPLKVYAPRLERLMGLLNLGIISVKSFKPIDITVNMTNSLSNKESAQIAVAFVEGAVKPGKEYKVLLSKQSKGHYKINITQR